MLDSKSLPQLTNALERLHDLLIDYPNNPEILWRIGKAHHKISEEIEDKEFKSDNISRGNFEFIWFQKLLLILTNSFSIHLNIIILVNY